MSETLSTSQVFYAPNALGQFILGQSYLGDVPPLNVVDTVASQYANSPSIMQLIWNDVAYFEPTIMLDNFYDWEWNVDTAIGYGLDVLGRIVGVTRVVEVSSVDYLGFEKPDGSDSSGEPFNQAPFYHGETLSQNFALSDDVFRAVVRAKAMANVWDGSVAGLNTILRFLFGENGPLPITGNSYVTGGGNKTMDFVFGSALSPVQQAIIFQTGVLPVPAGVVATVVVN